MRIVYILLTSLGGIPHYTAELANAVAKHSEVIVFKPKDSNDRLFSENVKLMNVFDTIYFRRDKPLEATSLKNLKSFSSYARMKMIDDIKPDVIHFTDHYPQSIFACLCGIDRKYPTVSTLHEIYGSVIVSPAQAGTDSYINAFIHTLTEIVSRWVNSDMLIVHTKHNRETLLKGGFDDKKVALIPHGAYTFFKNYNGHGHCGLEEKNCILFFGYILNTKGIDVLLEAMQLIVNRIPDAKLIIAGQGDLSPYEKALSGLRSNLEIYNSFISNEMVAKLFNRSKLIVLPYTYEAGTSGVLATALAFKKPAVVTDVGDLPNVVESGREGLVVPSKNPEALANAVLTLLKDEAMMKAMGENAYKKAQELSWDNVAKTHLEVYASLIDEKAKLNDANAT